MAARMPMITTTIKSSMSVKPLRFIRTPPFIVECVASQPTGGPKRSPLGFHPPPPGAGDVPRAGIGRRSAAMAWTTAGCDVSCRARRGPPCAADHPGVSMRDGRHLELPRGEHRIQFDELPMEDVHGPPRSALPLDEGMR